MKRKARGQGSRIIILILSLLLLSIGLAILCAKLILSEILSQDAISTCAATIAALLSFVVGVFAAKRFHGKKLICGLITCAGLFLVLLIGNLLFFGIQFQNVPLIAGSVLSGGILGSLVSKKKVRKYA